MSNLRKNYISVVETHTIFYMVGQGRTTYRMDTRGVLRGLIGAKFPNFEDLNFFLEAKPP